tara:strand:- start:909 stop:2045 length:1137 start_codon:yes stop_codon:yes gene_type:complete
MPNKINQSETHTVLLDDSVFELQISRKYLGQINIGTIKDQEKAVRYSAFENEHTALFGIPCEHGGTTRLYSITPINHVAFQAGGDTSNSQLDETPPSPYAIHPVLPNKRDGAEGLNVIGRQYPIMNFFVKPPNGRSMYAILDWHGANHIAGLRILMALIDESGITKLYSPPIPNNHGDGNICIGNLTSNLEPGFSTRTIDKIIKDSTTSGFNSDIQISYTDKGYFKQVRNSEKCEFVWTRPLHTSSRALDTSRADLRHLSSCITLLEQSPIKKLPITTTLDKYVQPDENEESNTADTDSNSNIETNEEQTNNGIARDENLATPPGETIQTLDDAEPVVVLPEGYEEPAQESDDIIEANLANARRAHEEANNRRGGNDE